MISINNLFYYLKMLNRTINKLISKHMFCLIKTKSNVMSAPLINNNLNLINNNFYSMQKKYFFGNKKTKEEEEQKEEKKEDTEDTKDKKDTKEATKDHKENKETKEETISLKKYNSLKELYDDSESNLAKARTKFDELRKAFIENQADLDRIRKRSETEIANSKEFSITKFAKDMLDVFDNFDRALNSISDLKTDKKVQSIEESEELIKKYQDFSEGIVMTKDSLTRILAVHGVKQYNPVNEKFDPSKHEAVFQSESDKLAPGTVSDVMQTGFTIGTRILRPAKVGVVKKK